MKITLIRAEKESRKEALSTLEADALIKKLKTETKAGHVSTLRAVLPQLEGTCAQYEHIDKLPRIYPAVEYSRTQEGERWMKNYNGHPRVHQGKNQGLLRSGRLEWHCHRLSSFCGCCLLYTSYWPQFNTATYKEVWGSSAARWLMLVSEF